MFKNLCLAAGLIFASSTAAQACSPEPQRAVTDLSYEQKLAPYIANVNRNMVDSAGFIALGTFKFSERKKAHRFKTSETFKVPSDKKLKKRVSVTFNQISDNRVSYNKNGLRYARKDKIEYLFTPSSRPYGIDGTYGPGDCGISLELSPDETYLVFANRDFEITSMLIVDEQLQTFQNALKQMVENPSDLYGINVSLPQMIAQGNEVKLLETANCSPMPTYKILQSSKRSNNEVIVKSIPIMVFEETEGVFNLSREDYEQAIKLGQQTGLYKNAPALQTCVVGQKYLMLGQFLYSSGDNSGGQWIPEKNGYFDLSKTAFEYHMTPEKITFDEVKMLLDNIAQ